MASQRPRRRWGKPKERTPHTASKPRRAAAERSAAPDIEAVFTAAATVELAVSRLMLYTGLRGRRATRLQKEFLTELCTVIAQEADRLAATGQLTGLMPSFLVRDVAAETVTVKQMRRVASPILTRLFGAALPQVGPPAQFTEAILRAERLTRWREGQTKPTGFGQRRAAQQVPESGSRRAQGEDELEAFMRRYRPEVDEVAAIVMAQALASRGLLDEAHMRTVERHYQTHSHNDKPPRIDHLVEDLFG